MLWNLLHTVPKLFPPSGESDQWVRQTRVFWTYLRSLPACRFSTPSADLLSARRSAVADYASYQERFHADFAAQHYTTHKWLVRISARAFFATLLLVIVQLFIAVWYRQCSEDLPLTLMITTLICAWGAFVLVLLTHQLGFEAIAERSNSAAQQFRTLHMAIEQEAYSADAQKVYEWADECAEVILAEQHSWYRHIPLIRMHL
jgi:hypothetical protein